ncbi:hypothetical protein [Patulibacter defluvii]|uniref:hypothetical protein n=1 Tax=Patulibacter defluvii TaxID=3095358 RepID=UPI002A748551|nr:hypothetical protein [Patulibacter sp. DM4]
MLRLRRTPSAAPPIGQPVVLRRDRPGDVDALQRLAERDARWPPPGPLLVAEREGRIEAALSLTSGEAIADPFQPTGPLVELLRCHAAGQRRARPVAPAAPAACGRPGLGTT